MNFTIQRQTSSQYRLLDRSSVRALIVSAQSVNPDPHRVDDQDRPVFRGVDTLSNNASLPDFVRTYFAQLGLVVHILNPNQDSGLSPSQLTFRVMFSPTLIIDYQFNELTRDEFKRLKSLPLSPSERARDALAIDSLS